MITYLVRIDFRNYSQDLAVRDTKNQAIDFIDSTLHKEDIEHTIIYELNTITKEVAEYLDYGVDTN